VYCVACDLPVRVERQPAATAAAAAASSTCRDAQAAAVAQQQQQQQQQQGEHRRSPAAGAGVAEGCTAGPAAGAGSLATDQLFSKQEVSDLLLSPNTSSTLMMRAGLYGATPSALSSLFFLCHMTAWRVRICYKSSRAQPCGEFPASQTHVSTYVLDAWWRDVSADVRPATGTARDVSASLYP
jgi:hypothetical protein